MIFHILGSGTIHPGIGRNCSGYLVDDTILFDCGPGIWKALHTDPKKAGSLAAICLSHFHPDHVSDLGPILMSRWMIEELRAKSLSIYGPAGLRVWFENLKQFLGKWVGQLKLVLNEMDDDQQIFQDYLLRCVKTGHTDNSIAWKIEDKDGRALFYSGDTDWNPALLPYIEKCDLAVVEASNTMETKIKGHLTPELAIRLAEQAEVKKLILTHPYPEVLDYLRLNRGKLKFNGELLLAEDGLKMRI